MSQNERDILWIKTSQRTSNSKCSVSELIINFRNSDSLVSYLAGWIPSWQFFFCLRPLRLLWEQLPVDCICPSPTWQLVSHMSLANSSSQNGRSFPTVICELSDDSSSPLDAKRMSHLEVTGAKWVLSGTGCFVHFLLKMLSFILLILSSLLC